MLIKFLRFLSPIFLTTIFSFGIVYGNSSNPPSQDCASCHTGNINTGDGSISLSGLPLSYFPGQTYNLTLTILGTNSRGFGFQLSPSVNGTTSGISTATSDMAIENGAVNIVVPHHLVSGIFNGQHQQLTKVRFHSMYRE